MKFRASILGALASAIAMGSAIAADLPSRKGPIDYPPPPPIFNWTGWHFGVNGGYGGGSSSTAWTSSSLVGGPVGLAGQSSTGTSGFVIGGQSGYLWQFSNNFVLGYESDFQFADVRSDSSNGFAFGERTRLEWFGTERLRFGYAFGRLLPYFTGGLAYGKVRGEGSQIFGFSVPSSVATTQAGFTVGGGLEYAVWGNVSVKAEYLYVHFKGPHGSGVGFFPAPTYNGFDGRGVDTHIARVGVNFSFPSIGSLIGIQGL